MYEVCKSSTAVRLGIDNTPSDKILEVAEQVAIHILQPVRDQFGGFSPNSWFRCEELEKAICKSSFERWLKNMNYEAMTEDQHEEHWQEYFIRKSHPRGEAVDFEKAGVDNRTIFNWCKENLPAYDQLIAEFMKKDDPNAGWIHGSYSDNNRMQIKEIK